MFRTIRTRARLLLAVPLLAAGMLATAATASAATAAPTTASQHLLAQHSAALSAVADVSGQITLTNGDHYVVTTNGVGNPLTLQASGGYVITAACAQGDGAQKFNFATGEGCGWEEAGGSPTVYAQYDTAGSRVKAGSCIDYETWSV
jgi:hypothetical protein